MIQHYVKVSKILMWIQKQKDAPEEEEYGKVNEWDAGYDACLEAIEDTLKDFPLEDDDAAQEKVE